MTSHNNHDDDDEVQLLTSTQSATVKRIKSLLQKRKKRTELGLTVVEGPRLVLDLLNHPHTRPLVQQVLVDETKWDEYQPELQSLRRHDEDDTISVWQGTSQVLQACSDTVTPQGIVATVRIPTFDAASFAAAAAAAKRRHHNDDAHRKKLLYLILDGVADPGNAGTLLRTAVATGVAGVILLPGCCDLWQPKALRSAMTASFGVPTLAVPNWDAAQACLQTGGGVDTIWAATMMDVDTNDLTTDPSAPRRSVPYYQVDWCGGKGHRATALVIGNEGSGLSASVRDSLLSEGDEDALPRVRAVHVPMHAGIESLNAAICGSVILFEYLRQCQQGAERREEGQAEDD